MRKKKYKHIFITAMILLFLLIYLIIEFIPTSTFNYEIIPQCVNNLKIYFIFQPQTDYIAGDKINISFKIIPKEIGMSISPLIKTELIISTQLKNSSAYITYDNKIFEPDIIEHRLSNNIEFQMYYFPLLIENKTINVLLNGNCPEIYKNLIFVHVVQRNHYLTEKHDRYLGEQRDNLKY